MPTSVATSPHGAGPVLEPAAAHGVVGIGDSLISGYGLSVGGVTCLSWAAWLSWALLDCCTLHAVNGAATGIVVRDQLPLLAGRYRVGCVGAGTNDLLTFDPQGYSAGMETLLHRVRDHADVVVVATLPLQLRTPHLQDVRLAQTVITMNRLIRSAAAAAGAVLVDVEQGLRAPYRMGPDGQHPTSLGQLEVATLAARALAAMGFSLARHLPDPDTVTVPPSERVAWQALPNPGRTGFRDRRRRES